MSKGEHTREQILVAALNQASAVGLEGLSIGGLAAAVGMSKSGLFAHFGSKTELQTAVLAVAAERFTDTVVRPILRLPRGEARMNALFEGWMTWTQRAAIEGGCVFAGSATEFDDRPGPVRDAVEGHLRQLRASLERSVALAVEEGQLKPDLDVAQAAFAWHGIMLAYHMQARLFRSADAERLARVAFADLIARCRA